MPWGDCGRIGLGSWCTAIAVVLAALCVSACSAGDVQFEGKLFELAGMNNIGKNSKTPQMAERTGLIVPPDLQRLPDPNQPAAQQPGEDLLASINDPDRVKVVDKAVLERQQAEVCKGYEMAKVHNEPDADQMKGPLGPCRKSVLNLVGASGDSLFSPSTDSK